MTTTIFLLKYINFPAEKDAESVERQKAEFFYTNLALLVSME